MNTDSAKIWLIVLSSLFFAFLTNVADFYPLIADPARWVPVNTPPLAIGDEYHYFSILKMMALGNHYGIPYDSMNGVFYIEFIRIVPYLVNLPVYYFGASLLDCRYGILFVRFFDMMLLFLAMYYFLQTLNRLNGWKESIYLPIVSVFIIFYSFNGLQTFFVQSDLQSMADNVLTYFYYLDNERFIYNNSTLNDLGRAINSSTTAPIFLFLLAYRLRKKAFGFVPFLFFLVILAFTSLPLAVVFGFLSITLDMLEKMDRIKILLRLIAGGGIGIVIIALQSKLIFAMTISAQEVIDLGSHFSFGWGYFAAPIFAFVIIVAGKRHLSRPVIAMLLILSLFQPLAMSIGGEHGSRLWLRSAIIPYLVLSVYVILSFITIAIKKLLLENTTAYRPAFMLVVLGLLIVIGKFNWSNAAYLAEYQERFVDDPALLSYILKDKSASVIVTNSTQVSMLSQLYDPSSRPLMGHYSLQPRGYRENWAKTLVNFELLGIPSESIIQNINQEAPQRHWLGKRETMRTGTKDFEDFYFDELLFISTYTTYNHQMLHDKTKNAQQLLEDSFYQMHPERSAIYSSLKTRKLTCIIDDTMPLVPTENRKYKMKAITEFSHFHICSILYSKG